MAKGQKQMIPTQTITDMNYTNDISLLANIYDITAG